jgi:hypothetical protein
MFSVQRNLTERSKNEVNYLEMNDKNLSGNLVIKDYPDLKELHYS